VLDTCFIENRKKMYAVVDIETTGGNALSGRITEIAIVLHDGKQVTGCFETLVNPEMHIPPYIVSLTGITNEMVAEAPRFHEVAKQVYQLTEGRVFVAHNVNFDYSFIKREFASLGGQFSRKKLCTVRLSRKILPGISSYSLGNLCDHLGVTIKNRHRANGDAQATARLLEILIENDKDGFIEYSLKKASRESWLPPNLSKEHFESLPEEPGVYYFHDKHGTVIYVGKAKNIKSRVKGHFTGTSPAKLKLRFNEGIYDISYEKCGNELIALLYESHQIKHLWPLYNRAQKSLKLNYGLFHYFDQKGYSRFSLARLNKSSVPLIGFATLSEGRTYLQNKAKEYILCPKLCGLQKSPTACFDYRIQQCDGACIAKEAVEVYNLKAEAFVQSLVGDGLSYLIVGNGRQVAEQSVVMVENGRYMGFGYVPEEICITHIETVKDYLTPYTDTRDVQKILSGYVFKNRGSKQILYY
jgi:DNA polymerase III subunit epsilon